MTHKYVNKTINAPKNEHKKYYSPSPIIVVTFSLWNLYANVTTTMRQG